MGYGNTSAAVLPACPYAFSFGCAKSCDAVHFAVWRRQNACDRTHGFAAGTVHQRKTPSIRMVFFFVPCEHYGSAGESDSTGVLRRQCRLRVATVIVLADCQNRPRESRTPGLRPESSGDRTTGLLRNPYSKKRCHPFGWHLFLASCTL